MRWEGIWRRWGNEKDYEDKAEKESEEIIIMNEGRTISLKELVRYVLLKWRAIVAWMVIVAVLAGGFAAVKSYMTVQEIKRQSNDSDYSEYERALTDEEIQEVKDAADDYMAYEKTYLTYKKYMSNSVKMKLDANSVPTRKLIYQIKDNTELINIGDAIVEYFPNNDVCEEINKTFDLDMDSSYVRELISVSNSHIDSLIVDDSGDEISNIVENDSQKRNSILISLSVIADNEEKCVKISNFVEEKFENALVNLENQFGKFDFKKIGESYVEEVDRELLTNQQTKLSEMYNVKAMMTNVDTSLSDLQKSYFEALIEDDIEELMEVDSSMNSDDAEIANIEVEYINLKYIIAGMVLGVMLAAVYQACKFMLNKHLLSLDYIELDLNSSVLSSFIRMNSKKKTGDKVDIYINSLFNQENQSFSEDEKIQMLCTNICVLMKKKNLENVYVTSSIKTEYTVEIINKIISNLKHNNIRCETGNSFLYDIKSLEKFADSDSVIFVEEFGKSWNSELCKEVEYCKKYNVNNLGFVTIR